MNTIYSNANFQNVILTVLALVVILVIVGCIYTLIRAIILFIFSNSKEENKKKGRNSIRFMIIGVIFTIVLLFLIPTILRAMKVAKYNIYTPGNILTKAGQLITGLFNLGNVIKQSQENSQYRGELYDNNVIVPADSNIQNNQPEQPLTTDQYNL